MRLAALMLTALFLSATALPALAHCTFHEDVARSETGNGQSNQSKLPAEQSS
ncbi:hypothetical protein [Geminicoccus harenae]|uniref:hypothetical protein n=1 Tax=Geminicoccus harenae TaxID=2498453 RepID=UPI00168B24BB|nr:hypothetical protein [Geminicoccus harenae]